MGGVGRRGGDLDRRDRGDCAGSLHAGGAGAGAAGRLRLRLDHRSEHGGRFRRAAGIRATGGGNAFFRAGARPRDLAPVRAKPGPDSGGDLRFWRIDRGGPDQASLRHVFGRGAPGAAGGGAAGAGGFRPGPARPAEPATATALARVSGENVDGSGGVELGDVAVPAYSDAVERPSLVGGAADVGDMRRNGGPILQDRATYRAAAGEGAGRRPVPLRAGIRRSAAVYGVPGAAGPGGRALVGPIPRDHAVAVRARLGRRVGGGRPDTHRLAALLAALSAAGAGRHGGSIRNARVPADHDAFRAQPEEADAGRGAAESAFQVARTAAAEPAVVVPGGDSVAAVPVGSVRHGAPQAGGDSVSAARERGERPALHRRLSARTVLESRRPVCGILRGGPGPADAPLQTRPAHEQAGHQGRDERSGRQSANEGADSPAAARSVAAPDDERGSQSYGGGGQSHALCGSHPLPGGEHGGAGGGGQGQELSGAADPPESRGTPSTDHREPAAGAGFIQVGGSRAGDPAASVPRGGGDPGIHFQTHERETPQLDT